MGASGSLQRRPCARRERYQVKERDSPGSKEDLRSDRVPRALWTSDEFQGQSLTAVGRCADSAEALRQFLKSHGDGPEAMTARRWREGLAKNGKIRQD